MEFLTGTGVSRSSGRQTGSAEVEEPKASSRAHSVTATLSSGLRVGRFRDGFGLD
jgi:hypothetical protein